MEIQIKTHFQDWKTVDKDTAIRYINNLNFSYKTKEEFIEKIEKNKLRGIKVLELIPDFWERKNTYKPIIKLTETVPKKTKPTEKIQELLFNDEEHRKKIHFLAREQLKLKLLQDLRLDLEICKFEGWDYKVYLDELLDILLQFKKKEKENE